MSDRRERKATVDGGVRRRRHWTALIAVAAVLLLGGGAVFAVATAGGTPPEAGATPAAPSATQEPDAPPPPLPATAVARGTIERWDLADETELAAALPELGDAAEGAVALRIDAPAFEGEIVAARTTVAVEPGSEYTFDLSYRQLIGEPARVPAVVQIGDLRTALEDAGAAWVTLNVDVTAPDSDEMDVSIILTGPVRCGR